MASWDLSPLYRHAQSLVLPDSARLVSFHNGRVVLRSLATLQILRTWSLAPPSPPSASSSRSARPAPPLVELTSFAVAPGPPHYVLCYAAKARTAWVLDPEQDEIVATLEVGNEGAVRMDWAQVGSAAGDQGEAVIMAWSSHHLRLSLYRLSSSNASALHILNPKHSHSAGHAFHPRGSFLAILERHNSRDVIGIYSTKGDWALVRSITLPDPSSDLAGLSWSPCGRYIGAWSHVTDYLVHFYLPTGQHLSTFSPYSSLSSPPLQPAKNAKPARKPSASTATATQSPRAEQEKEKELSLEDRKRDERSTASYVGLGVRTVEWHGSGEWVAIGGYDGKIRILSHHGFVTIAELGIAQRIAEPVMLWREPQGWVEKTRGKGIVSFDRITTLPYTLTPVVANPAVPNPKMGFSRLLWSSSGAWLVGLNQSHPNALSLFSFPLAASLSSSSSPSPSSSTFARPALHTVILFANTVRDFAWQPNADIAAQDSLVVVSGESAFAVWTPPSEGGTGGGEAEGVGVPAGQTDFPVTSLSFSRSGDALLLSSQPSVVPATTANPKERKEREAAGEGGAMFCVAYPVAAEEERTWIAEE
ncbi:hypothetical protein JCM10213_008294 [Rhodosporidiobolus nylandii]